MSGDTSKFRAACVYVEKTSRESQSATYCAQRVSIFLAKESANWLLKDFIVVQLEKARLRKGYPVPCQALVVTRVKRA